MTDTERYFFDLYGYVVVPGALAPEQVTALNALVDDQLAAQVAPDATSHRFGRLLGWGSAVQDVIANARLLPHLHALIGTRCRLDHDYLDVILKPGLGPIGAHLHGGGAPHDPSQHYTFRDGHMVNGLIVVAYALKDVRPGDGGFACVPASHKANYRLPDGWSDLSAGANPCAIEVACDAGDAVLFTEALTHGTAPWRSLEQRRTLFLKYSPHFQSWSARYYDPSEYPDLPVDARRMLEAPNARYRGRPTAIDE
jgi:hypothetical protein